MDSYFWFGLLGLAILYIVVRFIVLEIATITLRRIRPLQAWFRSLNAAGRLQKEKRSPEVYGDLIRRSGKAAETLIGRGFYRFLTFALLATALIFLATLPIRSLQTAKPEYDAYRTRLATLKTEANGPPGLCLLENSMAQVERKLGRSLFKVPPNFSPYPFDERHNAQSEAFLFGEPAALYTLEMMAGNKLTEDVKDIPAGLLTNASLGATIRAGIKDGKLTYPLAKFVDRAPENYAFRNEAVAWCGGALEREPELFKPVRPLHEYSAIYSRTLDDLIGFLDDREVQDAYYFHKERQALSQFGFSLFQAFISALLLWGSAKFAIAMTRLPIRRFWTLVSGAGLTASLVSFSFFIVTLSSLGTSAVGSLGPYVLWNLSANVSNSTTEATYRRHATNVIDKAARIKIRLCQQIGDKSPLTNLCDGFQAYLAPWNPVDGSFDLSVMIPQKTYLSDKAQNNKLTRMIDGSMLSMASTYNTFSESQKANDIDLGVWRGANVTTTALIIISPLILLALLALVLIPVIELRWTVVKRVDRIVKP
ncbi:hypothetical protein [Asticcacaulis sp. AC402]|uniref:hypothetical protein n=1 Tax=Asticcacaulis sp. AC402 TaxID=1282361 RepID=UPI0003C3FDAA|nr:hypothetical protein [Asticcacaulis sp. AC402]ESQ73542.1 hypothetical protein ABAC402_18685 [Asticcacaulis sp. AC402]